MSPTQKLARLPNWFLSHAETSLDSPNQAADAVTPFTSRPSLASMCDRSLSRTDAVESDVATSQVDSSGWHHAPYDSIAARNVA